MGYPPLFQPKARPLRVSEWRKTEGISRTTAWRRRRAGVLKSVTIGGIPYLDAGAPVADKPRRSLVGKRYHAFLVIGYSSPIRGHWSWIAQCECGKLIVTSGYKLRNGWFKHCGCGAKPVKQWAGDISAKRWAAIRRSARYELPTVEEAWMQFVTQGKRCAISGRELGIDDASYDARNKRWVAKQLRKPV